MLDDAHVGGADDQTGGAGKGGNAGSGSSQTNGGSGGGDQGGGSGGSGGAGEQKDPVSFDVFKRTQDDLHRWKTEARTKDDRIAALEREKEERERAALTEKEDFKTLAASEKARADELQAKLDSTTKSVLLSHRHQAAYPALKKAGLRDDAENLLDHMPLDDIKVEVTSTGRILTDRSSVGGFVESMKAKYPFAFSTPGAPRVNTGGTSTDTPPPSTEDVTARDVFAAEQKWKAGKISQQEYEQVALAFRKKKATG